MKCIISCEHASNRVPPHFSHLFQGKEKVLNSHQAYDHGAARLARSLAKQLYANVHLGTITRLLIDLNRSPTNRKTLFTAYSRQLDQGDRQLLFKGYYLPYREKVEGEIDGIAGRGRPVLHISLHSFATVKSGRIRKADIGLLYDPSRKHERELSVFLADFFKQEMTSFRIRRNYPYLGKSDGFTAYLRRKHNDRTYAGIEIEINQALLLNNNSDNKKTPIVLAEGLRYILQLKEFSEIAKKLKSWGKKKCK
ncbi:MAG: N-formylglutamate amidohydrolase [Deltaproteobacteria bacterium]|jgi:predicted N-formylglutamate amidohydrolase|nr:N-formylglutamate amidohydrolase [Deltaproteobacteria bacterium]